MTTQNRVVIFVRKTHPYPSFWRVKVGKLLLRDDGVAATAE